MHGEQYIKKKKHILLFQCSVYMQRVQIVQISWNRIYLKKLLRVICFVALTNLKALLCNARFFFCWPWMWLSNKNKTHTHTHTECIVVFVLQKWLRLRAAILRFTKVTYRVLLTCKEPTNETERTGIQKIIWCWHSRFIFP